jgi:hypothetical protein
MSNNLVRLPLRAARRLLRPVFSTFSGFGYNWLSRHREHLSRQLLFDTIAGFTADCGIQGSYLEFGCAYGGSLVQIFRSTRPYRNLSDMQYFIFDSFEGLPESKGLDGGEAHRYEKGQFACDLDRYKSNVRRQGVDLARVTCIPGWYDKTLNDELKQKLPVKKAC